jgi:hypothetical protein
MNAFLCGELDIVGTTQREEYLLQMCKGCTQILGKQRVQRVLWEALPSEMIVPGVEALRPLDKLIAAISVQSYPTILKYLADVTTYRGFEHVPLAPLGPIVAAVALEDHHMLVMFLEHIRIMKRYNEKLSTDDVLAKPAIELAITKRSDKMIDAIFQCLQCHSIKGLKDLYQKALKQAIDNPKEVDLVVVGIILNNCPGGLRVSPDTFLRACKSGNVALVELLVAVMDVHTGTILTLPLHQAIKSGDAAMIDCVLDAGADINHKHYVKNKGTSGPAHFWARKKFEPECPLEFATTQTLRAVEILLKRGAIVPPKERWREASRQTYIALREARMMQTGEDILTWKEHWAKRCAKSRSELDRYMADLEDGRRLPRSQYDFN